MSVVEWVLQHGGVVRTAALRDARFSQRSIRAAVDSGLLTRPRRGWVASRDADPSLVAAARAGVVLSCVTAAEKLGLFVFSTGRPHVAAPPHSGTVNTRGAHVHWAQPIIARPPGALMDALENALILIALCRPFEQALATWESALRLGMVDALELDRLPLPTVARSVLHSASPFSDSGLESIAIPRLRWLGLPLVPQAWIAGHRVDLLIGERLVLQIDGGHHVGRQRESDIAHDATLVLMGYHVIRVGYSQVVERWHEVQHLIMRAVAQGLHRAR